MAKFLNKHNLTKTDLTSGKKLGLPRWLSGKESACQCRRWVFNPWVWKIPWRRKWQPAIVFLPGKSHRQKSLVDFCPWGHKRVRHSLTTKQQQQQQQQIRMALYPVKKLNCYEESSCISLEGWEMGERFKREGIYVYLFMLRFNRKQQNSVKQLSFN